MIEYSSPAPLSIEASDSSARQPGRYTYLGEPVVMTASSAASTMLRRRSSSGAGSDSRSSRVGMWRPSCCLDVVCPDRQEPRDPDSQPDTDHHNTSDDRYTDEVGRERREEVRGPHDDNHRAGTERGTYRKQYSEPPHGRLGARI